MSAFKAELSKLFSLPGVWLAFLLGALAPAAIAVLDILAQKEDIIAGASTRLAEVGYIGLAIGVQGVILLGVFAVSSEYTSEGSESGGGLQLTTSLTVVSSRLRFLLAKAGAVAFASLLFCVAAIITTSLATHSILGEYAPAPEWPRLLGVACYWMFTALLAFGFTVLTTSAMIPLTVLMINSSVVSFSILLSKVTQLSYYLPDRSGFDMFMVMGDSRLTPLTGGFVMFGWVAVLFTAALIVFHRRDIAS